MKDEERRKFKTVWVTEPSRDFSKVYLYTADVQFLCNGHETGAERDANIQRAVDQFDPDTDAWVPVGRMVTVANAGLAFGRAFPDRRITLGIYYKGDYAWELM